MSSKVKKETSADVVLPVNEAFDHLLTKNWFSQSEAFRTKYKSCRSKYNSGDLKVTMDKKKEMLLAVGYALKTELTFICPANL